MLKVLQIFLLSAMIIVFAVGCNSENSDNDEIAFITVNADSEYENTFQDLGIGIVFDFNLKLPNADNSWVDIWVEGYSDGKAIEPFPIRQLSYGLSPNQEEEGPMGFGIINPSSTEPQLFLYSQGTSNTPRSIGNNFWDEFGISDWDYAIGSDTIGIESGEERILAVYLQNEESMRIAYEYQNTDSVNQMIEENKTVLLFKIKVEESRLK